MPGESHICSTRVRCTVPGARITFAVQSEGVQCPKGHNRSTIRGCPVPRESSHLQYQGRLYSARRVKSAVPGRVYSARRRGEYTEGRMYSARRATSAVPGEGYSPKRVTHLQYQERVYSTKKVTYPVTGEVVQFVKSKDSNTK